MAASLRCSKLATAKPVTRRVTVCKASANSVDRRTAFGALVLPALLFAPKANALILDEEDEELVEKAKANRKAKIAQNRATTRQLLKDDGIVDRQLAVDLKPVQTAVFKLAQVGAELEKGDVNAASRVMTFGSWVKDFESATSSLSSTSTSELVTDLNGLKDSLASSGDLKVAKSKFVSLVADLQAWAVDSKLDSSLKGL